MPTEIVPRILFCVGFLFLLCLASTFPLWAAAQISRTDYRSLMSSLACSMRIFFYSICLLAILVTAMSFNFAPADPRDPLLGWIWVGGTVWIVFPSAWRAFRQKGPRIVACGVLAVALSAALFAFAARLSPGFAYLLKQMPYALSQS